MFLQSIKLGGPYQVLAVCKYAIVPTTIGKTFLKITKTRFMQTKYLCVLIHI